jgi:hypothetical protein
MEHLTCPTSPGTDREIDAIFAANHAQDAEASAMDDAVAAAMIAESTVDIVKEPKDEPKLAEDTETVVEEPKDEPKPAEETETVVEEPKDEPKPADDTETVVEEPKDEPKTTEDAKTPKPRIPGVRSIVNAQWYEPMSAEEALEQKVLPQIKSYELAPRTKKMDRQIKKILKKVYAEAEEGALGASVEEPSKALVDMTEQPEDEMEQPGMKIKDVKRPFPGCRKPLGFKKAKTD